MSDFAPGFAGRIQAAEHVLQRAFSGPVGFAPAEMDRIGRRAPTTGPGNVSPGTQGTECDSMS